MKSRLLQDDRWQGYLLVAPALIALGAVSLSPLLAAGWLSLHRHVLVVPERPFIGLDNWRFWLGDARFRHAFFNTLYFSLVAVTAELVLGLCFALLLSGSLRARGLLRAGMLLPWCLPTVVSAKLWAYLFNPSFGLVPRLLPLHDVSWLGTPGWAMHAAIVVDAWKTTPFMALLLLAGLQGISSDVKQAAAVDGANTLQTFRWVTLPLLMPTLTLALLFRLLDALRVFDAIYVLTEGGPANTTESLSIYAYKTLMRSGDFGYGSTLALATFLCILGLSIPLLMATARERRRVE